MILFAVYSFTIKGPLSLCLLEVVGRTLERHTKRGCAYAQPHNESPFNEISYVSSKRFVAVPCKFKRLERRQQSPQTMSTQLAFHSQSRCRKLYQIMPHGENLCSFIGRDSPINGENMAFCIILIY